MDGQMEAMLNAAPTGRAAL